MAETKKPTNLAFSIQKKPSKPSRRVSSYPLLDRKPLWSSLPVRKPILNRVPSRTVRAPEACRRNGVIPGAGKFGRQSRSPATVSEGGAVRSVRGKSPPSITFGQYSYRPPAAAVKKGCAFEKSNGSDSSTGNETLKNPLVSLECFIFL